MFQPHAGGQLPLHGVGEVPEGPHVQQLLVHQLNVLLRPLRGLLAQDGQDEDLEPSWAMVSKHSSKMEVSELRELRGLEAMEEEERGRPLASRDPTSPSPMSTWEGGPRKWEEMLPRILKA